MKFLKRFGALLTLSLAFAVFCGEVPESLNLSDDASNDFVEPAHGPEFVDASVIRQEATLKQSPALIAAFPSFPVRAFVRLVLSSGPNLLRLLSIQRK